MNLRRRIYSWSLFSQSPWRRIRQVCRHSAIFSLCLLFMLTQQRCSSALPPIALSRDTMLQLLASNPYDQTFIEIERQLLRHVRDGAQEKSFPLLDSLLYEAGAIFHVWLEKSLRFQFLAQNDSAAFYSGAAAMIGEFMAHTRNDGFFLQRQKLLQENVQSDPRTLEQWLRANAVFIRGLNLDTKDCALELRCFKFARKEFQALGDEKKVVDTYWLAHFFLDRQCEKTEKLQAGIAQWLALSQKIGYRDGELEAYLARAEKYGELGHSASALANYTRVEKLAEHIGKTISIVHIIAAHVYESLQRGDLEHAQALTQRGLELCRKHGFRYVEADLLEKLAAIHHLKQEYRPAMEYLEAAMALHRALNEHIDLPPLFLEQAKISLDLGDFNAAQVAADSARQNYLALNDHAGLAKTYGVIGVLHARAKNWQAAIACEQRGLEQLAMADTLAGVIDLWTQLGELRLEIGDAANARAAYEHALRLSLRMNTTLGQAKALLGLGKIALHQAQPDSAQAYMNRALGFSQATGQRETLWRCHYELAMMWEQQGRPDLALRHYESAIHELEAIRNTIARLEFNLSYFSTVQEVFDRAIAFAVKVLQDEKLALCWMEQSRGRNVLARLEKDGPRKPTDFAPHNFDVSRLLNTFDDSTALLEYRVTDEGCYLAFIKRGELKVLRLPFTRAEVERWVINFRRTLGVDDREAFEQRLRQDRAALIAETEAACVEAYQRLLAPLAEQLQSVRTLYISPDGPLHYVPFGALQRARAEPFLAETLDLAYAPSLCVLAILREQRPRFEASALREALVLALKSRTIPFAVAEACEVARILVNTKEKVYDRLARAEMRALLEQPRGLIHLALHADLNDKLPFYSYLLLDEGLEQLQGTEFNLFAARRKEITAASSLPQENVLLASDLLDLNLRHCELIVLSACKTALGQEISGEGMMGLTQGFLCAGAARLATSLWEVDDQRTFELMKHFYSALISEKQGPARALRTAQTKLIQELHGEYPGYPFPYFWASFVLTGSAD